MQIGRGARRHAHRRAGAPGGGGKRKDLNANDEDRVEQTRPGTMRTVRRRLAAGLVASAVSTISGAALAGDFYVRGGIGLERPAD